MRRTTPEVDGFAYAIGYDPERERYLGLTFGESPAVNPSGLVVKPDVAIRQRIAEEERTTSASKRRLPAVTVRRRTGALATPATRMATIQELPAERRPIDPPAPPRPVLRRFHGSVELNSLRAGRDAGQIAENIIAHLEGLTGARVRVTLEIEADLPDGAPEQVVRTVSENARTLHFESCGFEEE